MRFDQLLVATLVAVATLGGGQAFAPAHADDWEQIVAEAEGQTVYWNAWAGDEKVNAHIEWVADQVDERFGIDLIHVKMSDTAEAVSRVLAEKTAGRTDDGSIDMIWINGENFLAMKEQDLLFGPFAEALPNFARVDVEGKPSTVSDFTVPTDGLESPWGMAQYNFVYDSERVPEPPRSMAGLLAWIEAHPGRFTYPAPPDHIGSTFLKHVLIETIADPELLERPVDPSSFLDVTAPVWSWLEAAAPNLWRSGEVFPATGPAQHQLMYDGEVDFSLSFDPGEASAAIETGTLPESARTFILEKGTIGNTHFVAIPFNATHKAGAQVVANFLLSPEAQAQKQDPRVWGDGTVLDLNQLTDDERALFDALPLGVATLPPEERLPVLPEPHPSWMTALEAEWLKRFSS